MGTWVLFRRQRGRGLILTTHFYVVSRLRMSGVIPLFPLYAFMVLTRSTFALLRHTQLRMGTTLITHYDRLGVSETIG